MACYDNIIGIARADCPCFDSAPPNGYNTSKSNIYLADLKPLDALGGYSECGAGSIWEIMEQAIEEATQIFISDTNSALMQNFKSRKTPFKGQIGEASARELFTTDNTYAGIRLAVCPTRGGIMRITAIGTVFSAAGLLSLKIHNSLNEEVWAGTVNTANGFELTQITPPIELPTYIDFDDRHEYFLTYTHNPSNPAKRNGVNSCGCGGFRPTFSKQSPMWQRAHTGANTWANWVMVGGWEGNTLTDFDQASSMATTQLNGLALQVELGCDISQIVCNGELNFNTDPLALSIAFAIRYKSAELLGQKIIAGTALTRENVINREAWQMSSKDWQAAYEKAVLYIAENATVENNDCLTCKDPYGMTVNASIMTWADKSQITAGAMKTYNTYAK
jgi:hypothetical protein